MADGAYRWQGNWPAPDAARRIVELHGGSLSLESGPKGGSVARIELKAIPS